MEPPRQSGFTADAFIAWALAQPTGRFELSTGMVVAMASERADHNQARLNAVMALRDAIGAQGLPWAMTDGVTVRIDDRTVYGRAGSVRTAPDRRRDRGDRPDHRGRGRLALQPGRGSGRQARELFLAASVPRHLIVDTDRRVVLHNGRDGEGRIMVRIVRDGSPALDPPGLAIEVDAIFAGV